MRNLKLKAPAKINYLLNVVRRRQDGYHDLRMIMQLVDLCDDISVSLQDSPDIKVVCGTKGVPDGPGNIAWKAARTMLDIADSDMGAIIEITKNIPVAAGLGGGSSDAATVLMGMRELLELKLTDQRLMEIAVKLGADVPFFIFKKTALAEGIGEKLTAIPDIPKAWILLVNPGVHVSTAWVFRSLQLTNRRELNRLPQLFATHEELCSIFSNDLETVTIPAFPVINEIKESLLRLGALASMMSGSGPTVFGLFRDLPSAERARSELSATTGWFVAVAETL